MTIAVSHEGRGTPRLTWPTPNSRVAGNLPSWVAFALILPFGLNGGYTTVALIFLLSRNGVGAAAIGGFLFLSLIPQTVKFLYAPLIDTTLGPRRWHAIGTVATAASLIAFAFVPATPAALPTLTVIGFLATIGITLVAMPTDAIIAYDVAPDRKGRAAGWAAAGNLGGSAAGGGLAMWLVTAGAPGWASPLTLAALCLLCMPFVLLAAPREAFAAEAGWLAGQRTLLRDVWAMLRSRPGALTLLLAMLPIGTGAMQNLLPAIARDWHAGAVEVALVSGAAAGVLQIAGALLGGLLCDRFDRRWSYCAAGALMAAVSVAMALGPRTAAAFVGFSLTYVFLLGVSYAALAAAILEAIGKGAAASKYTLIICVSNAMIFGEGALEGWVHDRFSLTDMLLMESAGALVAVAVFALAAGLSRTRTAAGATLLDAERVVPG